MAEGTRIGKLLKKYNIGISTLQEFLAKKGIAVDGPNAMLDDNTVALLDKEFFKEQKIKEESQKVANSMREIIEKNHKKDAVEEVEPEKEIIIKTNSLADKPAPAANPVKPEPVKTPEQPTAETDKIGPKILGHIDLTPKAKTPAEKVKKEEPAKVVETKTEPVEEKKVEPKPQPKPAPVEKKEEPVKAEASQPAKPETQHI